LEGILVSLASVVNGLETREDSVEEILEV
jgi:hypothetical protein